MAKINPILRANVNTISSFKAIVDDDQEQVGELLGKEAALASASVGHDALYDGEILHWLYVGGTTLHLAAAGAGSSAAQNRRRSGPVCTMRRTVT